MIVSWAHPDDLNADTIVFVFCVRVSLPFRPRRPQRRCAVARTGHCRTRHPGCWRSYCCHCCKPEQKSRPWRSCHARRHCLPDGSVSVPPSPPFAPFGKLADALWDNGVASITIYMALAAEFILRVLWRRPVRAAPDSLTGQNTFNTSMKRMLAGLTLSSLCIYVRYAFAIAVSGLAPHTETACVQERISDDRAV